MSSIKECFLLCFLGLASFISKAFSHELGQRSTAFNAKKKVGCGGKRNLPRPTSPFRKYTNISKI